jgi:small subunit ribosomal protein S20
MAHHKSAIKRISTNERDYQKNKAYTSTLRSIIKKVRAAASKDEAESLYKEASSTLDKLANKRIIHKNKAANQKAKLAAVVNKLSK